MNSEFFRQGEKYISSKRAVEITGYSRDYIGELCRKQKLEGLCIQRTWFITEASLFSYIDKKRGGKAPSSRQHGIRLTQAAEDARAPHKVLEYFYSFARFFETLVEVSVNNTKKYLSNFLIFFPHLFARLVVPAAYVMLFVLVTFFYVPAGEMSLHVYAFESYSSSFQNIKTYKSTQYETQKNLFSIKERPRENLRVNAAAARMPASSSEKNSAIDIKKIKVNAAISDIPKDVWSGLRSVSQSASERVSNLYESITDTVLKNINEDEKEPNIPTKLNSKEESETVDTPQEENKSKPATSRAQDIQLRSTDEGDTRGSVSVSAYSTQEVATERVIERTVGGVSQENLTAQLNALANELRKEIFKISDTKSVDLNALQRQIALSQRVDNLNGVTLTNATFSNTSGVSPVLGLTDADIPDNITVSGVLSTSGGTISSDLTIGGALTLSSFSATSSDASTFIQASTTRLSISDVAYFGGTATSTFDSTGALSLVALGSFNAGFVSSASSSVTTLSGDNLFASSTIAAPVLYALDSEATSTFSGFIDVSGTNSTSTFSGGLAAGALSITGNATSTLINGITIEGGCFAVNGTCVGGGGGGVGSGTIGQVPYYAADGTSLTATSSITISTQEYVGISSTTPWRRLSVSDTVSNPQFVIAYDSTSYASLQVDSVGDLILDPSGDDAYLNADNFWVCTGGSCPSGTPSGTGNLIVETALGIASSTPWGGTFQYELAVAGDANITGTTTLGYQFTFSPIEGTTTELGVFDSAGALIFIFDEQQATST